MSPRFVGSMHHRVADAFAVLGVLADGDVDHVVVDDRRADDVVARAAAAERRTSIPWDWVELPEQLGLPSLPLSALKL